jgi:hypothetical protein
MNRDHFHHQRHNRLEHGLPGAWKVVSGRAIALKSRESGMLRVARGSIWATFDGPHKGVLNDLGGLMLHPSQQLALAHGERRAVESWKGAADPYFWRNWQPLKARAPEEWLTTARALEDLRLAFGLAGGAFRRLLWAMGDLTFATARGFGNWLSEKLLENRFATASGLTPNTGDGAARRDDRRRNEA